MNKIGRTIRFYQSAYNAHTYARQKVEEALERGDKLYSIITVKTPEDLLVAVQRFQNHECNLLQIVGDALAVGWNIGDADDITIEFDDSFPSDEGLRNQALARVYRTTLPPSTTTKQ